MSGKVTNVHLIKINSKKRTRKRAISVLWLLRRLEFFHHTICIEMFSNLWCDYIFNHFWDKTNVKLVDNLTLILLFFIKWLTIADLKQMEVPVDNQKLLILTNNEIIKVISFRFYDRVRVNLHVTNAWWSQQKINK